MQTQTQEDVTTTQWTHLPVARRKLLVALGGTVAYLAMPTRWNGTQIQFGTLPAHADTSGDAGADAGADAQGNDAAGDAGTDARADASGDAGADAGADAGTDAGADASADASAEAAADAGTDAAREAGVDAGPEASAEAGPEASTPDAGPEAAADAGPEASAPDAGPEAGVDTGLPPGPDASMGGACGTPVSLPNSATSPYWELQLGPYTGGTSVESCTFTAASSGAYNVALDFFRSGTGFTYNAGFMPYSFTVTEVRNLDTDTVLTSRPYPADTRIQITGRFVVDGGIGNTFRVVVQYSASGTPTLTLTSVALVPPA